MEDKYTHTRIAIVGGGPSALFMYKRLIESGRSHMEIDIYERRAQLGAGMPYSQEGANDEHVTNVSDNEIPTIVTHIAEWVHTVPAGILQRFNIDPDRFNEYKVLPRLFFGMYLSAQFELLRAKADEAGITTDIHYSTNIKDIIDQPGEDKVLIEVEGAGIAQYDRVIICTGHYWPVRHEGTIPGYYDSPYPPSKLKLQLNHAVALRGSSLTAIDALRTLARHNGRFEKQDDGMLTYLLNDTSKGLKIIMHSRGGFLPGLRFHLEDPHLSKDKLLSDEEINKHMQSNDGFLSLDFIFEKDFEEPFRTKDPEFYKQIKDMKIEQFVPYMMALRERLDAFQLFRAEYAEAEQSIKRRESVYWKELLAILSFAMNYPAKHFSAEDMMRLQKVLMPLISIVIAFIPQESARELLAMHDAGVVDLLSVGEDSHIEVQESGGIIYHYTDEKEQVQSPFYKTFIDCIGQPHLSYEEFPFKTMIENKTVSHARLKFKYREEGSSMKQNGKKEVEQFGEEYYLRVPGITINDQFQITDHYGAANPRIYMMAVPYISGFNPDYSGLDFCEAASKKIGKSILI